MRKQLSWIIENFYCNVRLRDGEFYKKNSLLNIRKGICRNLKVNSSNIDIICDPDFAQANNCFSFLLRKARAEWKGAVAHHPALKGGDLKKFYSHEFVFNVNVPHGLLKKVVFEIMFYFCRRGQENLTTCGFKILTLWIQMDKNM